MRFTDFTIIYDVDCVSDEYSVPSILTFTFPFLEYVMEINRNHIERKIVPVIRFSSIGTFTTDQYPNNAYTQIIAKEVKSASSLKTKLTDTVTKWSEVLQEFLDKSIQEVKYPELCYYCP